MLNRRSFFRYSLATGLGLPALASAHSPNEYERGLAEFDSLDVLGRPQSWSLVRDGLHPISPERVILMTDQGGDGWSGRDRCLDGLLKEHLNEAKVSLLPAKIDLILRLMQVITDHYGTHLYPPWAINLAKRESLASTGLGNGFGLLHQFQDDGILTLKSPPVDWWLALFPGGIEWESWEPVHGMLGQVFPSYHPQTPGLKMRAWILASNVGRIVDWVKISRLDRIAAAKAVNQAILGIKR